MAEYRLSSQAKADLDEIANYTIEKYGIEQARCYRDGLESCFQTLADTPMIGRSAAAFFTDRKSPARSLCACCTRAGIFHVTYRPGERGVVAVTCAYTAHVHVGGYYGSH